jgi:uncharacterized BrkB/YihY/UPF0761 family membrane protein
MTQMEPLSFSFFGCWPRFAKLFKFGERIFESINRHDLYTLAGSTAFVIGLSLSPLLIVLVAVLGLVGDGAQTELLANTHVVFGKNAAVMINALIESSEQSIKFNGLAGAISFCFVVFSASATFSQLLSAFNRILDYDPGEQLFSLRNLISKRLAFVGLLMCVNFLLVTSLVFHTYLKYFYSSLQSSLLMGLIKASSTLGFLIFFRIFIQVCTYPKAQLENYGCCGRHCDGIFCHGAGACGAVH